MKYPSRKPIRIGTDYMPVILELELTRSQGGDLLQAILDYLFLGKEPEKTNPVRKLGWTFIRWDLDYEKRRKEEKMKREGKNLN